MSLRQQVYSTVQKLPTISNSDLYKLFPKESKNSIRTYANEIRRSIKQPLPGGISPSGGGIPHVPKKANSQYQEINIEMVKDLLLRWANGEDINSQLVRYCIDYCKGFKESLQDKDIDLDLEVFKNIGKSFSTDQKVQPGTV